MTKAPCFIIPSEAAAKVKLVAPTNSCEIGIAHAPNPMMGNHVVLGSFGGWIVTGHLRGVLRMANPVTGHQARLPDVIAGTIAFLGRFILEMRAFTKIQFGSHLPPTDCRFTKGDIHARRMVDSQVVLPQGHPLGLTVPEQEQIRRHAQP